VIETDELGAHMSIAGGLPLALERGRALDCFAVQIFVKNQRQWAAPPLADSEARAFRAARRATAIASVFAHGSYLVNLASPGPAAWRRAVDAFTDELERAEALGLACVAIHPGSHLGTGVPAGIDRVAAAVTESLRRTRGYRVRIALENTAGGGGTLGRTFAELGAMLDRVGRPRRLGVCLDTCHLFAAGYDLRLETGYRAAMAECAAVVGLDRVLAFHLNDARAPLGSGLDRHEHIGRGRLGLPPFRYLLNDARFADVPKVLETPKEPEPLADRRNLAALRRLRATRLGAPTWPPDPPRSGRPGEAVAPLDDPLAPTGRRSRPPGGRGR
jgi:deoxyribonuclease-4